MTVSTWPFPGLVWGSYPQQAVPVKEKRRRPALSRAAVRRVSHALHARLDAALDVAATLASLRATPHARRDEAWLQQALLAAAAAMAQVAGVRAHRQQLMAARALLDQRLVEMDTGEGKTVAIALAAATAALAGTPVHVVTANDYLAQRDAEELSDFYRRLGLTVGAIAQPHPMEQRRAAYACDVTYCTAKELAFDYLRDGLLQPGDLSPLERQLRPGLGQPAPVLRGLCMAILDEADTILIDEARVPLVLSQAAAAVNDEGFLGAALALARESREGRHFRVDGNGVVRLLPEGEAQLAHWPVDGHPLLAHPQHRASTLAMAITAWHRLERDRDYVVRDGEVQLVDETTGRAAPGRAWSRGLHQLVEMKEGLATTRRNATVTQITFQRFFIRFLRLAGISGTLRGAGAELRAVYGLSQLRVPPRTPRQVVDHGTRLLPDSATLWQAVAERAARMHAAGRPVLVGTETVAQAEALAAVMRARGLGPTVLHARQDAEEGAIIGAAGQPGRITVATSMAGRGAHVGLPPQVLERGGLHVILCQLNASARIDRQFLGRTGRQGQPGSCEVLVAWDFPLLQRWLPAAWRHMVFALGARRPLPWITLRAAQGLEAFTRAQHRVTLARLAEAEERELNFSRWGLG